MAFPAIEFSYLALQEFELPALEFPHLGPRAIIGIVMIIHIFFAELFIGYAVGSPLLVFWGRRTGNRRMERLAYSIAHFNVLTFSVGATWAVMFLVIVVGLYPRVTAALFTHFFWFFPVIAMIAMVLTLYLFYIHFYRTHLQNIAAGIAAALFILLWQAILSGIDTFMVTGGGAGERAVPEGAGVADPLAALDSIFNPMFIPMDLHRTFGNLSWPAYAVAAWAGFMYVRSKTAEDRLFYDWAGSMGVIWGTVFLLFQPFAGFAITYFMKLGREAEGLPGASTSYERLVGAGSGNGSFTSDLLYINLLMIVGLFMLSNVAMYLGAARHPERAGRVPIRFFGLLAAVAGLYAISPLAEFPFLHMRYIMMLVMVLATLGTLVAYLQGRRSFRYGSPGRGYRAVLMALGVLAAVLALNMGFMKSNSRVPYTIYGQPSYQVTNEGPVTPEQLRQRSP